MGGPFVAAPSGGIVPVIGLMLVILGVVGLGLLAIVYWWHPSGLRIPGPERADAPRGVTRPLLRPSDQAGQPTRVIWVYPQSPDTTLMTA